MDERALHYGLATHPPLLTAPPPQVAVLAGVAPCLPGMAASLGLTAGPAPPLFSAVYDAAWFVGVAASSAVYAALMRRAAARGGAAGGRAVA